MRNLKQILGICEHKWATYQIINVVGDDSKYIRGKDYVLKCEKCGKIKVKRVYSPTNH